MESHRYNLDWSRLVRIAAWPVLFLGVMAIGLHGLARLGAMPPPLPALDVDRTILLHQADASARPTGATTVLVGDSSCLMNVAAPELQRALGQGERVINLGAISYLDLEAFAALLKKYLEQNRASVRRVVLLMHPEALRLGQRNEYFRNIVTSYWERTAASDSRVPPLVRWSGAEILRTRLLSRWVPSPLPGAWGEFYGFSRDLWNYLDAHQGSAIDPRHFSVAEAKGNPEYRLAAHLENASAAFRTAIPEGVQLVVGITPSPEGFVTPSHEETCRAMLEQWADWLHAGERLADLPCSLPDDQFASTTHLNAAGRLAYTEQLARALRATDSPSQTAP